MIGDVAHSLLVGAGASAIGVMAISSDASRQWVQTLRLDPRERTAEEDDDGAVEGGEERAADGRGDGTIEGGGGPAAAGSTDGTADDTADDRDDDPGRGAEEGRATAPTL